MAMISFLLKPMKCPEGRLIRVAGLLRMNPNIQTDVSEPSSSRCCMSFSTVVYVAEMMHHDMQHIFTISATHRESCLPNSSNPGYVCLNCVTCGRIMW